MRQIVIKRTSGERDESEELDRIVCLQETFACFSLSLHGPQSVIRKRKRSFLSHKDWVAEIGICVLWAVFVGRGSSLILGPLWLWSCRSE